MKKDAPMFLKFHLCHFFTPQNPTPTFTLAHNPNPSLSSSLSNLSFSRFVFVQSYTLMEMPEYFVGGYFGAGGDHFSPEKRHADQKPGEQFAIDDLLDFSNADVIMSDGFFDNVAGNSADSSTGTAFDSCNSSISGADNRFSGNFGTRPFGGDPQFSGELCLPVSHSFLAHHKLN